VRERLEAAWYAPRLAPLATLLLPLSWLFAAVVALRRWLYRRGALRSARLPVPVVVIGNVTVGGTGKTPLVIALARALAERGRHPGIVSRGYGASGAAPREVTAGAEPADVGDEPLLLAAAGAPVFVARDRAAAARALLAAHPACDVVLADDGLQHYALARDVEVVVVDGTRGFGNGRLLPSGPLREPASRADAADAVVTLVADAPGHADGAAGGVTGGTADGVAVGRRTTMTHVPVGLRNLVDPARAVDPAAWPRGSASRRIRYSTGSIFARAHTSSTRPTRSCSAAPASAALSTTACRRWARSVIARARFSRADRYTNSPISCRAKKICLTTRYQASKAARLAR